MSLPSRLLGANPSIQVSTLLSGSLTTPSAKGTFVSGSYDSIATETLASNTVSITFSGIPSTYKHLQIRGLLRESWAGGATGQVSSNIRLNGDTGSNYTQNYLRQSTSALQSAYDGSSLTRINYTGFPSGTSGLDGMYGALIIDIHNYNDINKWRTVRIFNGSAIGTAGEYSSSMVDLTVGAWKNTADAVNSVTIFSGITSLFAGSTIALYGIEG